MFKLLAILFLINFGISQIHSRIIPINDKSISPSVTTDLEETEVSEYLVGSKSTTEGPSLLTLDNLLLDIFQFPDETVATSSPLDDQKMVADHADMDSTVSFGSRTNFRARKNCACLTVSGECAKNSMCR